MPLACSIADVEQIRTANSSNSSALRAYGGTSSAELWPNWLEAMALLSEVRAAPNRSPSEACRWTRRTDTQQALALPREIQATCPGQWGLRERAPYKINICPNSPSSAACRQSTGLSEEFGNSTLTVPLDLGFTLDPL